jgi:hypothetical protein
MVEKVEVRVKAGDQLVVGHCVAGERTVVILLLLLPERCDWLGLRGYVDLVQ